MLSEYVDLTITKETVATSVDSFGIPLIAETFTADAPGTAFTGRTRSYGSLSEIEEDWLNSSGEPINTTLYEKAEALFAQDNVVSEVVIGRKDSSETWTAALADIYAENPDFYRILPEPGGSTDAEIEANALLISAWAESNKKLAFIQTSESGCLDASVTTDLMSQMKAKNYDRTAMVYHASTLSESLAAAWVGEVAPYDIGKSTWAFKTPSGVTADSLTYAQRQALIAKYGGHFYDESGTDITQEGKVSSGEWIDVIEGIDWIESNIKTECFSVFTSNRKVSFDDAHIVLFQTAINTVLNEAYENGIILNDFTITVPSRSDTTASDRQARKLKGVKFTANLAGAIHHVTINGYLSE